MHCAKIYIALIIRGRNLVTTADAAAAASIITAQPLDAYAEAACNRRKGRHCSIIAVNM